MTMGTTVLASTSWMTSSTASTRIGYSGLIVKPSSTAGTTPMIPPTIGIAAVRPAKMPRMTGVREAQEPAGDSDHEPDREAVDRHGAKEAAHAESHLPEDVDDQVVVGFREQVDGECLETVAAHQPEKPDHEHEDEVDDDAEDRSADGEEDVPGGVDDRADLLGDIDVEVELVLDAGEPAEEILLVGGKVRRKRRCLS